MNITYHNGPIVTGTTKVYYIWYGNWSGNTATDILPFLAQSIGGSGYYNINTHLNPTNVCVYRCTFCAFRADLRDPRGYVMSDEQILERGAEAKRGGLNKRAMPADYRLAVGARSAAVRITFAPGSRASRSPGHSPMP